MKGVGSPKLLCENLDLTPIQLILWTDLHTEGPGRPVEYQPERMLHIGVFGGYVETCLDFALEKGLERGVARLNCDFPTSATHVEEALPESGFSFTPSEFIVMEIHFDS